MAGVQRCSGAIDATGTGRAGIGRLIDLGHDMYDFVLQLNQDFLSQFSPDLMSFDYMVDLVQARAFPVHGTITCQV
jgi:hypothetical protein